MIADVKSGQCDIGVLPFAREDPAVADIPYVREQLSGGVPYHHALAEYDTLTFAQINGFNCLLRDKIGFWGELCYEKMPVSKFLVHTEMFALEELIRTSTLLCFVTNFADTSSGMFEGRKIIPLTDPEADVQNSNYTRTGFLCIHGLKLYPNGSIMIYMSIIGNYIKEERKKAGLTQEEFAMRSGLGLRFVRELEQGKETVRLDKVNQALAMFGKEAIPGNKEEV